MSLFDRLENAVKSYRAGVLKGVDPDMISAMDELNAFLNDEPPYRSSSSSGSGAGQARAGGSTRPGGGARANGGTGWARPGGGAQANGGAAGAGQNRDGARAGAGLPPEDLRADFAELEVPFGAAEDECRAAYKRLLKKHHPDRHAGHEGNMQKATRKSARINAAYDRLRLWRQKGAAR